MCPLGLPHAAMGATTTVVVSIVLGGWAVVLKLLIRPRRDIVLERQSLEYDLREGAVYTQFLREAEWEPYRGAPEPASHLDDVPIGLGAPRLYQLSREGLAESCPYVAFDRGTADAVDILRATPKVGFVGDEYGSNAIGCGNLTYLSTDTVSEESISQRYVLSFDGFAHKLLNNRTDMLKRARAVSNYFSNHTTAYFSAPLHATMVSSMVVTCVGTKTWLFFEPECCNEFGHHLYSGALLAKGFSPATKVRVLQTTPGTVLTFGSFQHHMVITQPGPSFMQNYRHFDITVVLRGISEFGWPFLRAIADTMRTNVRRGAANQAQEHPMRQRCRNAISREDIDALQAKTDEVLTRS